MSITLSVLSEKGGSGKSTLVTNVGRGLQLRGLSVLLVDADPQGTLRDWKAADEADAMPQVVTLEEMPKTPRYDVVVIDGGPRLHAITAQLLRLSDAVLIPVQPSGADIWSAAPLVELIRARRKATKGTPAAAFVVSRQIAGTRLSAEVDDALGVYRLPVLRGRTTQRVAYTEALAIGSTVLDVDPTGKAAAEINAIVDELLELL